MRIRIDIDDSLLEDEVIIHCKSLDDEMKKIYDAILNRSKESRQIVLLKGNVEYFIDLEQILFFETADNAIRAHTIDNVYETSYRLYELEELLPGYFMRVSKSTILNLNHIFSITRNLTASSEVHFHNTHKQVYVSRYYYKSLKDRLEEKRKRA